VQSADIELVDCDCKRTYCVLSRWDARLDVSALGSIAKSAFSGQYLAHAGVVRHRDLSCLTGERREVNKG